MGRGRKFCERCHAPNGSRASNCTSCGSGFIIKGERQPDIDPKIAKLPPAEKQRAKLAEARRKVSEKYWAMVEDEDEQEVRAKYEMGGRSWRSICGNYRIREQLSFMGIDVVNHEDKCVLLMKKIGDGVHDWEVLRRFRKPIAAIKYMDREKKGERHKLTNKQEKIRARMKAKRK